MITRKFSLSLTLLQIIGIYTVSYTHLRDCEDRNIKEWAYLKNNIKESLKEYLYQKTKRNPMILPIIMEV